jgi:hypothetical protein
VAAAALPTGGCTSVPGLQDPQVTLSPRYYMYKLGGSARMQSVVDGRIVENAPMGVSTLGLSRRDDDYGGVLAIGDGFAGLEAEYQNIDMDDTGSGVLTSDYGSLPTGTASSSRFRMDEYRLTYVAPLVDHELELDDDNYLRLRFGAGAAIVHREGSFDTEEYANAGNNQGFDFGDAGLPYLSVRGRVEWRDVSLQVDWDYNPDISFGGDFEGHLHDIEILGRYTFDAQDITILAGYRWSDLKLSGNSGELRYDADFQLDGYLVGLEFTF